MILLDNNWTFNFSDLKLHAFSKIFVGFSGGLDSTVLLHSLASQPAKSNKLIAIHINHGFSINADMWQNHCNFFCKKIGITLLTHKLSFDTQSNFEAKARQQRYLYFDQLVNVQDCLMLGHHRNDQAETLLLQLCRGTGITGIAAMPMLKQMSSGVLLRPFLNYSRKDLEAYANFHQLSWIDDESNQNVAFSRNYLRKKVLPLLVARWPAVINKLTKSALHAQQALANLQDLAKIDCPALLSKSNILHIPPLTRLSFARISNVLMFWLKNNTVLQPTTQTLQRIINSLIYTNQKIDKQVLWNKFCVRRYRDNLYLLKTLDKPTCLERSWPLFPKPLYLSLYEGSLYVASATSGLVIPKKSLVVLRFRQGGELLRLHGQTKQLKKLLQAWEVPPWERNHIPLIYINEQLACIVGYAVSDLFYQTNSPNACEINKVNTWNQIATNIIPNFLL